MNKFLNNDKLSNCMNYNFKIFKPYSHVSDKDESDILTV